MWRGGSREVVAFSSSSSYFRPLTRAISYTSCSRLVPHPPDLLKWVRREGGFVHESIKFAQLPSYGLTLIASDDIPQGSHLIGLPPHLPLKFDDSSPIFTALANRVPEELWAMRLGMKLLQERAKTGSFWWPYISNLPETYSVPIFFEGEDIKNLQYAPVVNQVNKRCRFLLDFAKQVKGSVANIKPGEHPFGGQEIDAASLGWAMSAASSRAFRLHIQEHAEGVHENVPMMLPLIDMCNHNFCPNAKIIQNQGAEKEKMLVKVMAEKHIKRDAPLELNYGNMSNDLFLLDYGFLLTANPYDSIELHYQAALLEAASVTVGALSPYFTSPALWQSEILSALKLDSEGSSLKVTLGGPDLVDGRLLAASRVLHANDANSVSKHALSTLQSLSAEAPLGISNELAALRTIIGLCLVILQNFPTQIMEDQALLNQDVSSFSKLAIQFRLEKKSLIVNVMKQLSERIKLLQAKEWPAAA